MSAGPTVYQNLTKKCLFTGAGLKAVYEPDENDDSQGICTDTPFKLPRLPKGVSEAIRIGRKLIKIKGGEILCRITGGKITTVPMSVDEAKKMGMDLLKKEGGIFLANMTGTCLLNSKKHCSALSVLPCQVLHV